MNMKIRKSYICIALILLISCIATVLVFAHGGRTDANGGHYDRSTGEYHYHHGYPAHQHTNGVCPYDYDDKTNHSSGGSISKDTTSRETQKVTEQETLSWEEWKEKHWKKAETEATTEKTTQKDTTKNEENFFVKIYRKNPVLVIALGIWAVTGIYCYIKDKK
jgi:hypothetical protein